EVAQFRTAVFDRTVGPRDSAIARYTWTPQAPLAAERMPLTIRARLRHRRLQKAIHARACASASTPRGKAFVKGAKRHNGLRPDPCLEQPVLDLATRRLQVGAGAQAPSYAADRPVWMRLLQHGQGLTHHVQERLDEALMSLTKAASVLPDDAPVWAKAAVLLEQARVLGRQGRTDDAVALLEKVEVLKPNHPASARVRAESYAQVWRWAEAAEAWIQVTQHAPRDDRGWRGLAIALGSLGKREAALTAAQTGLALEPRDAHLLRSQSLAFARLAPDSEKADVAHEVWMQYRRDEASPGIKGRCADPDSDCQFERVPIPERALKTAVLP
ncbi:MAG: tetratricopeptide repeat protein, partial [Myxococcota bacterium]